MKKYFLIIIASTITTFLFACKINPPTNDENKPPQWVIKLAQDTGLKVVQGNELPYINSNGSYGSYFIKGDIYTNHKVYNEEGSWFYESLKYVIFLCRKENESYQEKNSNNVTVEYNYYLLFALSNKTNPRIDDNDREYKINALYKLEDPVGMHFLEGSLDIDLSNFNYLNDTNKRGPKAININQSWSVPIVIPYHNSRKIIVYYNDNWLINSLDEW